MAHELGNQGGQGVRQANVRKVLDALRLEGPSSQASLARKTALSPATVNNIVRRLREDGQAEVRPVNGRESLVALVSTQGAVASIQVNVGSVHGALFDFARGLRFEGQVDLEEGTDQEGGSPELVADLVRSLAAEAGLGLADLDGVAVAMQGPISTSSGTVMSWARRQLPKWEGVAIETVLEKELGVPVLAENDANLGALAEWTWGAGKGSSEFLYVACSAGIGGGFVLDGNIYRGSDGMAGEIGHMVIEPNGPVCFCGSRGCLNTFASERSVLLALRGYSGTMRSLAEVIDSARRKDPACQRVLFEAGRYLGRALANTAKAMAPSVVAIGGELASAGPLVFDSMRSSVELNSLMAASPSIRFRQARLGDDATLLGGVAAVHKKLGQGASSLPGWMVKKDTLDKPVRSA
ncbi:ROK family transcriptional regulator [Sinomonas sp. ASV486]|uniref:ROK family transcriptional regulator n=1 Tax=Sinomonas sp. ASV486 TaxID=3051170 RepID=UPI0027DB8CA0|nr:ROK family transcriptional regulator [Sinomonas sp. ASV486]MDQ4490819.1 ROK family transcriptional regulator [Sinomonas sp. ASV486]